MSPISVEDDEDTLWSLPHGELARRRHVYRHSPSDLAAEYGTSRQTIYDWLKVWAEASRQFLTTGAVPQRRSKRAAAADALREILKNGPRPADDGLAAARAAGIKSRALSQAKKDLGVRSEKSDFAGPWVCALPAQRADGADGAVKAP